MYLVYVIKNIEGYFYIGVTKNLKKRLIQHRRDKRRPTYQIMQDSQYNVLVLFEDVSKEIALDLEEKIVTPELIQSKYCVNKYPGGKGRQRSIWNKNKKNTQSANLGSFQPKVYGEKTKRSILTDQQRVEICNRYLKGAVPKNIAGEYGVHWSTLYNVINQNWRIENGQIKNNIAN